MEIVNFAIESLVFQNKLLHGVHSIRSITLPGFTATKTILKTEIVNATLL